MSESVRTQVLDLRPGAVYRFRGLAGHNGRWKYPPADYRLLCVALDIHTYQDRVVYRCIEGPQAGQCFTCGLMDWGANFERKVVVAETPPQKAAGVITTGSGV